MLCTKNGFNNVCLNFSTGVLYSGDAVNSKPQMHPDPQEIIPDYCQSHIFYHLQFIFNGSAQCESQTDIPHYGTGQISLSSSWYEETDKDVHSGFEAKYNIKKSVGYLTNWDTVLLQNDVSALSL